MKLILVRHGQAEDYKNPDANRQLTQFGHEQAKQTANYILDNYQPDFFVTSPYDRAQQTLSEFTALAPDVAVSVHDDITPADDAQSALTGLGDITANCIVVVCHMPIVAKLTALLTGESYEPFQLAEARILQMDFVAENMATQTDKFIPQQP